MATIKARISGARDHVSPSIGAFATRAYASACAPRSLGITLLELAHGHAPFAKYPPMKVLMMTLQNPPPTVRLHGACASWRTPSLTFDSCGPRSQLEADSGTRHFSRHLRDLVALCLQARAVAPALATTSCASCSCVAPHTCVASQKDPKKRPTAKALQDHRFLQSAKKPVRARAWPPSASHALPPFSHCTLLTPALCRMSHRIFLSNTCWRAFRRWESA